MDDESALTQEEPLLPGIWSTYKVPIILGSTSLLFILFACILLYRSLQVTAPIQFSHEASPSGSTMVRENTIQVDIEGAVHHPGVYILPKGSRVEDLIRLAGGLAESIDQGAFSQRINRAQKLIDGAKIYIPMKGSNDTTGVVAGSSTDISHPQIININTASFAELDSLPGVGQTIAGKIIAGRPYQTTDELVTKKIINKSLFEKLQGRLGL